MSGPEGGSNPLDQIRDLDTPVPDDPEPRTSQEERRWEQGRKRLTPTDRLDAERRERIADLKVLIDRHLQECLDLRDQLRRYEGRLSDLRADHAALKVAHAHLQSSGFQFAVMIVVGSAGASVGSYFIPSWAGYFIMLASVLTLVWGLVLQGAAIRQSRGDI